jgi:hypothetical protein
MKYLVAVVLCFAAVCLAQEQIRVQYTGVTNTFSILWQAANSTGGTPQVKFGYAENALTESATGTSVSYTACLVYRSIVKEVVIRVQPDRPVFYQVSNNAGEKWSTIRQFRSTPAGTHDFSCMILIFILPSCYIW